MARNPFRSEGEMFKLLGVVIAGAVLVVVGAKINTWVGVAVAVLAVAGIVWWVLQEPTTAAGIHRLLVVAAPGTSSVAVPDAVADVVIVVPALVSKTEALTGAVDDRRAEAEQTSLALTRALSRDGRNVRGEVGADDPVLAVEDALRTFGADEVLVVGDETFAEQIRACVRVPVRRA